ncbi:MAG: serine/threonine protein kinase, partial [Chitinivibrionales bacterium]|nr:serine/threonine protein kinase [Chitinivibrionales bacterium]
MEIINKRYRITKQLGIGGMGAVYLAEDKICNSQQIALKIIKQELTSPALISNFKNEFEVMTRLKHPHLVHVYDFGFDRDTGQYYMTMEYVNGKSLAALLTENALDQDRSVEKMVDLCRTVEFIHSRNIFHRDIKPANIMLAQDSIKLMDFGLADLVQTNGRGKKYKGTPFYMAPEILQGVISTKTDIYALGMTFFEMTGHRTEFFQHHSKNIISYLSDKEKYTRFNQKLLEAISDERFAAIIGKMVAYDPGQRYDTALEIVSDINKELNANFALETEYTKNSYVLGPGFV